MFSNASAFNRDISGWGISNVTNLAAMFYRAKAFNQPLSTWNVSNVVNMSYMFAESAFNQNIGGWNVSNVTDMQNIFNGVTLLTSNYDTLLSGWGSKIVQDNVPFHGGNSQYTGGGSPAETGRNALINTYVWTITDGGVVVP